MVDVRTLGWKFLVLARVAQSAQQARETRSFWNREISRTAASHPPTLQTPGIVMSHSSRSYRTSTDSKGRGLVGSRRPVLNSSYDARSLSSLLGFSFKPLRQLLE